MRRIESPQNPIVKELVRLRDDAQRRTEAGRFVLEGEDILRAALHGGLIPETLLVRDENIALPKAFSDKTFLISGKVARKLSALPHPSRVFACFPLPLPPRPPGPGTLWIYLDGLRDPGNVGGVLRSTAALGGAGVLLRSDCADPLAPKALRAAMGATFTCCWHTVSLGPNGFIAPAQGILPALPKRVIALTAQARRPLWQFELSQPAVVCIGAEREGLSKPILHLAGEEASIPQISDEPGSLNALVAASIALYEALEKPER